MLARTLFGPIALAAAVLAAPAARAADPVPVGKAEVQQLVTGKVLTVQFVDPLRLTLAKDGKMDAFGTASAIRAIGTWTVDEQGRLCMQSPNPVVSRLPLDPARRPRPRHDEDRRNGIFRHQRDQVARSAGAAG